MNKLSRKTNRGVTLNELLVVLAIISLLSTIAVPVYISQIQRARIVTAQSEVRTIAEAEQQVAILHGFFVPIHVLDNVPDPANDEPNTVGTRDDFRDMSTGTRYLIDVYQRLVDQNGSQVRITDTNNIRVQRMIDTWQGPFLNPKRVRYVGENFTTPGSGNPTEDLVVDPWGNPYRFYTEFGITGGANPPTTVSNEVLTLSMDSLELNVLGSESGRFDRYAIVSYGPDGVTGYSGGTDLAQGDDIYYEFSGLSGNETFYQGF